MVSSEKQRQNHLKVIRYLELGLIRFVPVFYLGKDIKSQIYLEMGWFTSRNL